MKQFKNLKRAIRRGHLLPITGEIFGTKLYRRVKSDKLGAGRHVTDRMVSGIPSVEGVQVSYHKKWCAY